jgi:hypothetical protein
VFPQTFTFDNPELTQNTSSFDIAAYSARQDGAKQQRNQHHCYHCHQTRSHETVVQQILSNLRRAGLIERNGSEHLNNQLRNLRLNYASRATAARLNGHLWFLGTITLMVLVAEPPLRSVQVIVMVYTRPDPFPARSARRRS